MSMLQMIMKVVDQRMLYNMYCTRSAPIYTHGDLRFFSYEFDANICGIV